MNKQRAQNAATSFRERPSHPGMRYRYLYVYPSSRSVGVALATYDGRDLNSLWLGILKIPRMEDILPRIPLERVYLPNAEDVRGRLPVLPLPEGVPIRRLHGKWRGYRPPYRYGHWMGSTLIYNAQKMALWHATSLGGRLWPLLTILPLTSTLVEATFPNARP
jgi:hypothetical protein